MGSILVAQGFLGALGTYNDLANLNCGLVIFKQIKLGRAYNSSPDLIWAGHYMIASNWAGHY